MRFFLTSCCFCFKIHQAFIYIIYLDLIRLLWVILFTILLFLKPLATIVDYSFNAIILSAIFSQCFNALKSLNYGFLKNDYKIHKKYLCSKILFLTANLVKLSVLIRLNCSVISEDENCLADQIDAQFCVDLVWTLFEIYLALVVYSFCTKVNKGFYGPIGGAPIFQDMNNVDNVEPYMLKLAYPLEVKGVKAKNVIEKDLEIGILVANSMENPTFIKKTKSMYFRIFPMPVFRLKRKEEEICDLSTLMEVS